VKAASSSFAAFTVGAIVPLMPWFFARGTAAVVASVALGLVMSVLVGMALAYFTGRSTLRTVIRQLAVSTIAAGITFGIGNLVGVSTTG
jgi:VIT1/CCC1 family predicted Fe2+/Mn2+ transporter